MNSKNMNYCYNVEYFQDILLKDAAGHNDYIYQFSFRDSSYRTLLAEEEGMKETRKSFCLKTVYPGLLIGTGYLHEGLREAKNSAIKLGFSFDHVTGLPVIPGSSLKGVLRSYFPERQKQGEKTDATKEMLAELTGLEQTELKNLEKNLFEGADVFLGGFPIIPKDGRLLDSEYITPHKDQFKNPIPLRMLKVRPNITFEFLFLLHDYGEDTNGQAIMTADEKLHLYKELLLLGGIGAKTNVGFGQFEEAEKKTGD